MHNTPEMFLGIHTLMYVGGVCTTYGSISSLNGLESLWVDLVAAFIQMGNTDPVIHPNPIIHYSINESSFG